MINQTEILKKLKSNFKQADLEYIDDYHLKDIKSNLYFALYDGIDERANSIHSSAAMIYNTIGPNEIIFDGVKYPHIVYEREFPALNENDKSDHDHSAHLDVSLISEDKTEMVLVEAKCLEWLHNPKSLSIAYLSNEPEWIESLRKGCEDFCRSENGEHSPFARAF